MRHLTPALQIMLTAAEKAGTKLTRDFGDIEKLQVSKKGPKDFVTNADLRAEQTITGELSRARPDYCFLTEENGEQGNQNADFRWVVDPLDGTTNYMHGIPHFCTSIALQQKTEAGWKVISGLVYEPLTGTYYSAEENKGAYINGIKTSVSGRSILSEAVMATGNHSLRTNEAKYKKLTYLYATSACSIRNMGAAALDLAYVAAGKYEAFWHVGLKEWDIAAGMLLVKEAGGHICELNRHPEPLKTGNILACNNRLAPKLEKLLSESTKKS